MLKNVVSGLSLRMSALVLGGLIASSVAATDSTVGGPRVPAVAHARDSSELLENALYLHPVSILAMAATTFTDDGVVGLQLDYERRIAPHFSGIATVSYLGFKLKQSGYDVDVMFFDLMAGARWYPTKDFEGFYLQPTLDFNMTSGDASNSKKKGSIDFTRLGGMLYLGTNRRFGWFTVDWNVGVGYMGWDDKYTETKFAHDGKPDSTYTNKITAKVDAAGFLLGTPQFGTNLSLGMVF